jgi:hypothetical protein
MESGGLFRPIDDVLVKHEVPFVIIGGQAVGYHGYLRATAPRIESTCRNCPARDKSSIKVVFIARLAVGRCQACEARRNAAHRGGPRKLDAALLAGRTSTRGV